MRTFLPALALIALTACVEDVGKDKVAATVEDAPTETTTAEKAPAKGQALKVDTSRSSIRALGAKITATHPVDAKEFSGEVTFDGKAVTAVSFKVDMAKIEADHPKLTSHLLDEDFFHVEVHPDATFKSASIKEGSETEGMTHTVSGDLTIRGKTKRVTFPAAITVEADAVKANTEFTIDRQDFGVSYPGRADDLVQDNVVLTIAFVAPRSA